MKNIILNLVKLFFFLKPSTVFSVFKMLHLIMKLFGLYPFKIEQTRKGPKPVICIWGLILTTAHFANYFFCYIESLKMKLHSNNSVGKSLFNTFVDTFGVKVLLSMEALTVFGLFLNILITFKDQRNMISLFYETEIKLKNFCFDLKLFKIILFSFFLLINFLSSFFVAFEFFAKISITYEELIYFVARMLPVFYIQLKTSQCCLYVLTLYLNFEGLNKLLLP